MSNTAALPGNGSREEYEDFVFREVMALYAESESRRIADEAEIINASSKPVRKRRITSLIKKVNNQSQKHTVKPFIKKLISTAAAVVLIVTIALNTSITPIAAMRVRAQEINDKFTEMNVKVYYNTIEYSPLNPIKVFHKGEDIPYWEARYRITYIPQGFKLYGSGTKSSRTSESIKYYDPNEEYVRLSFRQSLFYLGPETMDTSYATINTVVEINGYSAFFISQTYPWKQTIQTSTYVLWAEGDTLLRVIGYNMDPYEVLKVAEHIIRIK